MARNVFTRTLKSTLVKLTTRKPGEHSLSTEQVALAGTYADEDTLFKAARKACSTPDCIVVDAEAIDVVCKKYTMSINKFIANADKVEDAKETDIDTETDTADDQN